METWFLVVLSLCVGAFLKSLLNIFSKQASNLPPEPPTFSIIGNFLWLRKSIFELEPILRSLHAKLGPIVTFRIGSKPTIFVADRGLAYQALVQNGAVFSDRPPTVGTAKIQLSNQHTVGSASYGPTWRLLRRNLTAEILHPSRVKSYASARNWVLKILINRLESHAKRDGHVYVAQDFQFAMFCLLVLMCFGEKLDEKKIEEIQRVQREFVLSLSKFNMLNYWPRLTKLLFPEKWSEFLKLQKNRENVIIALIKDRIRIKEQQLNKAKDDQDEYVLAYADTLLDLQLPDEKRKLKDSEMISLCNEFLNAGTDTTSSAMQWIMANLVKYPQIQEKLLMEIKRVVEDGEVKEEDLQKMPYLKAIILEGLRRHPPAHFLLPHVVTEDVKLGKYVVPKKGIVNFMVHDMGMDPKVWEDPWNFKPERFVDCDDKSFDITGSREIKMMPFGAGRRICPAYSLAMLHLEYFVANLILKFEWKPMDGDPIDLSEKQEFSWVMKNPLKAQIFPRVQS